MLALPGYQVGELIHQGRYSKVYRATRTEDDHPVILKGLVEFSAIRAAKLRREYDLGRLMRSVYVLQYYRLAESDNGPVIVMEDFGGQPLTSWLKDGGLDLHEFLNIATKLAGILENIHRRNVIHKDIKPDNFLLNPKTGSIKIIDFGIASLLPSERASLKAPEMLEGTMGYMSPEQRGVTQHAIDYRTDFFALGATFYHLLTGQAPVGEHQVTIDTLNEDFDVTEHDETVDLMSTLESYPHMLVELLRKCMAERPEDRYQTAFGLLADLEHMTESLNQHREIRVFQLGQQDLSQRLQVPQKLYGRDYEISRLLAAFDRVREHRRAYMVLVSGEAGIGKSSVIHEIQKPIVAQQGYFVSGRCGQFKKETPYDPFITLGKSLVNQILAEPEFKIAAYGADLKKVLGDYARLIVDFIPEIGALLDPVPELPDSSPEDSQQRFQNVFHKFLSVFAKPAHPLTIFLDDLHWADDATLSLLEYLLTNGSDLSLFLIGTYRFDGSEGAHMLVNLVRRLGAYGELFETLSVSSLNLEDTTKLIVETLDCTAERGRSLAAYSQEKSSGNPFFIIQLLRALHQKQLLFCNLKEGAWRWSIRDIRTADLPDEIIQLITQNLLELPKDTLDVVKQAACAGQRFDLKTLSMIRDEPGSLIAEKLVPAVQMAWLQPDDEAYKFMIGVQREERRSPDRFITFSFHHDYIQQAAYEMLDDDEARSIHYAIARHFFTRLNRNRTDRYMMEMVEHLQKARITDPDERLMLAEWYLKAGRKAISTAGFGLGLAYFQTGWRHLPKNPWSHYYELVLALRLGAAEMAYCNGQYDLMNEICEDVAAHAKETLDLVKVYQLRAMHHMARRQFDQTMEVVQAALQLLGDKLPEIEALDAIRSQTRGLVEDLGGWDRLETLPSMTNPQGLAQLQLLAAASTAAGFAKPDLAPSLVFAMVKLSIRYGNAPESCTAYASLSVLMDRLDESAKLGKIAVDILERHGMRRLRPQVYYHYCCYVQHRKEHLDQVLTLLRQGIVAGYELREFEYAARCEVDYGAIILFKGANLQNVAIRLRRFAVMTSQARQDRVLLIIDILRNLALDFLGRPDGGQLLEGYLFHEHRIITRLKQLDHHEGLFFAHFSRMVLLYHRSRLAESRKAMAEALSFMPVIASRPMEAECLFYAALVLYGVAAKISGAAQEEALTQAKPLEAALKKFGKEAPMNRRAQYLLVVAERHRAMANYWQAFEAYDESIDVAEDNDFQMIKALAYERAGQFLLEKGRRRCAAPYLQEAISAYEHLAFKSKVYELNQRHYQVLDQNPTAVRVSIEDTNH